MRNMAVVIIIFNGFLYKNTSFRSILEILKVSKGHVTRYIHICTFLSFLLAASMAQGFHLGYRLTYTRQIRLTGTTHSLTPQALTYNILQPTNSNHLHQHSFSRGCDNLCSGCKKQVRHL